MTRLFGRASKPYSTGRKPWRSEPWRSEAQEASDEQRAIRLKIFYFGLLVVAVFGILTIQLARMQLLDGEKYRARAETNRLREVPIIPARGLIYDRNGIPLVENRATFAAGVVAADLPRERETEITLRLQEMVGVPAGDISRTLETRRKSNDPFSPAVIKDNITQDQAFKLREKLPDLPGVRVMIEPSRQYTEGALVSHVLGFVGRIDEEEYAQLGSTGYELTDYLGKTGVEYSYESLLRGTPGARDVETDASGREIRVLDERPARPGANLVLSVDLDLQRKVEEYLRAAMGKSINAAAVVVEVHTGDVLALVSLPSYDNNIFTGKLDEAALERIQADPGKPMLNHVIAEQYPPGSTFKQITGIAALQEGVASASTMITSRGFIQVPNQYNPREVTTFKDWRSDLGTMNFYRGVAMSSDVYFYYLAGGYVENGREVFQGLGSRRLADWTRKFGLGAPTGIDLPGEADGLVPDPDWKERTHPGEIWTLGDTYNFGIGQGFVAATPMQMALVTAAIANGGNVLNPHVVKEVRDSEGRVLNMNRSNVKRNLGVDPRNLATMREGMRQAVADGSAFTGASRAVVVAGKTGTAEFGERRPDGSYKEHGWFTGYAPFNDPQIAVAVFLEQGNGSGTAAPVASKIFSYYFSREFAQASGR